MIDLWQAIVLGIVQGITEFLPISSTAHLRIVPALLGWEDPGAAFSAVVQCGTLAAVIAYFRHDLINIARAFFAEVLRGRVGASHEGQLAWMMIVATFPIVIAALAFKHQIATSLRSLNVIASALAGVALLLGIAELRGRARHRRGIGDRSLEQVGWVDAIVVGCAQACALVPGTSRSGATILGGLWRGLSREAAARFSFLLSLPAIFAAGLYELIEQRHTLLESHETIVPLAVCTIVSGVVGYAAIALLLRYLRTHSTLVFIVYRLLLAAALLGLVAAGKIAA